MISNRNVATIFIRAGLGTVALFFLLLWVFPGCDRISDGVRNWGQENRRTRAKKLKEEEIKQWERDLNLSRARVLELQKNIHTLVQESNHQGLLSWKIANAFVSEHRFEMAAEYYRGAVENRLPEQAAENGLFEATLPYYQDALRRREINPDLLFDVGLCYANASRVMGWETNRWRTAVYLFEHMYTRYPQDTRSLYELALLYGKVEREELRNRDRAVALLAEIIKQEEANVPARFARANILVEMGQLDQALLAYMQLRDQLQVLSQKGVIGKNLEKNPQYRRVSENIEKLEICVKNLPGCEVQGR